MTDVSLHITTQEFKRAQLITAHGRIDSSNAQEFDEKVKECMETSHNLVMDLSGVNYMSSAGLRTLVTALRECKKKKGDVRLVHPSERVSEVLSLAGLDSLFQIFDDTTAAIGSF
jgi:anti-anti-sigma factor